MPSTPAIASSIGVATEALDRQRIGADIIVVTTISGGGNFRELREWEGAVAENHPDDHDQIEINDRGNRPD